MNTNRLHRYWLTPEEEAGRDLPPSDRPTGVLAANNVLEKLGNCLSDHPTASLAVATSIGVFLGWLIKRR